MGVVGSCGQMSTYTFGSQQCHPDSDPTALTSSQHEDLAVFGKTPFLLERFDDLQVHDGCVPVRPVVDFTSRLPVA